LNAWPPMLGTSSETGRARRDRSGGAGTGFLAMARFMP
jgi:hypothetical protein